jgi:hypothetical protein
MVTHVHIFRLHARRFTGPGLFQASGSVVR